MEKRKLPFVMSAFCSLSSCGTAESNADSQSDKETESQSETNAENGPDSETESGAVLGYDEIFDLPAPQHAGDMLFEEVLFKRFSLREYSAEALTLEHISQLLWAAQGITHDERKRTAPSAGALYPMEIFVATRQELFHYLPEGHRAAVIENKDAVAALHGVAQSFVFQAPAVFTITGVFSRTEVKYGERAERYVMIEAGHVCQNILLEAVALGLGAAPVGAFDDAEVQQALGLPSEYKPLYLVPVGHPPDRL